MIRPTSASTSSLSDSSSQSSLSSPPSSHKVKYRGAGDDWDSIIESEQEPIDVSLVLPHYRARNQPLDHRMNMFVTSDNSPVRAKVCRPPASQRCSFYLEVLATSDVTVWLPSDFQGRIHLHTPSSRSSSHPHKISISPGFSNNILANTRLYLDTELVEGDNWSPEGVDEVDIRTTGNVSLKMWDVRTSAPEVRSKETLKKIFGSKAKKPVKRLDWDFLLED